VEPEPPPDERRRQEAGQRQPDDREDERREIHRRIASYSSTSGVLRFRKIAMTIASPTVASAAATAMTISAMTAPSPWRAGRKAPKATIVRLTAFSISSIDMSIEIALRRARKPNVPMA